MRHVLLLSLIGCADPPSPVDSPASLLRVDAVPGLTLQASPLVPGSPLRLQATGAPPGTTVYFVRGSPTGTTCPPPMRGQCLGMGGATLLGQARVGPDGTARVELLVPTTVPVGFDVSLGAVVVTPTTVVISQLLDVEVQRPSACGDGVCGGGEAHGSCPLDCLAPQVCGDGVCGAGEPCAVDCGPQCVGPACDTARHTVIVDDTDTLVRDTSRHTVVVDDTDTIVVDTDTLVRDTSRHTVVVDDTDTIVVDTDTLVRDTTVVDTDPVLDTGLDSADDTIVVDTDTVVVDDTDRTDSSVTGDTDVLVDTTETVVDDTDTRDSGGVVDTSGYDSFDTGGYDSADSADSADSFDTDIVIDTSPGGDSIGGDTADSGGVVDTAGSDTADSGDSADSADTSDSADVVDTDDTDTADTDDTADSAAPKDSVDASRITPYARKCRDAKVPLPPKWGKPGWVKQNPAITPVFAGEAGDLRTELWRYDNARGTCAALPRIVANTPAPPAERIRIMGTICMNKTTGKTCFWDSRSKTTGDTVPVDNGFDPITGGVDAESPKIPDGMGGMVEVIEQCTDCHRGDNPWVSIRGTKTDDLPDPTDPARWTPIGPTGWENPEAPPTQTADCTTGCHTVPKLSLGWCTIATKMVGKKKMPPGGFDLTTPAGRDQKAEWDAIAAACAALPRP